jgi:hypothetical protein
VSELAKALRWTTPGALVLAVSVAIVVLSRAAHRLAFENQPDGELLNVQASTLLTGAALSIPLGFLVYQVYFFNFSRPMIICRAVRADLGGLVMNKGPVEIDGRLWTVQKSREPLLRTNRRIRPNLLRRPAGALWLYAAKDKPDEQAERPGGPMPLSRGLERRYYEILEDHHCELEAIVARCSFDGSDTMRAESNRLADVYHTLGACRWAVVLGWIGGVAWSIWSTLTNSMGGWAPVAASIGVGTVVLPVVVYLFVVMHVNRRHSFGRRVSLLRQMLAADARSNRAQRIPGWRGSRPWGSRSA